MYLKRLLICQLLAVLLVEESLALSCIPCHMVKCPGDLSCPGGKVRDICGCCPKCAMMKDEDCGGPFNIAGTCDKDLVCVKKDQRGFNSRGVCQETFIEKLKLLKK